MEGENVGFGSILYQQIASLSGDLIHAFWMALQTNRAEEQAVREDHAGSVETHDATTATADDGPAWNIVPIRRRRHTTECPAASIGFPIW